MISIFLLGAKASLSGQPLKTCHYRTFWPCFDFTFVTCVACSTSQSEGTVSHQVEGQSELSCCLRRVTTCCQFSYNLKLKIIFGFYKKICSGGVGCYPATVSRVSGVVITPVLSSHGMTNITTHLH